MARSLLLLLLLLAACGDGDTANKTTDFQPYIQKCHAAGFSAPQCKFIATLWPVKDFEQQWDLACAKLDLCQGTQPLKSILPKVP